MAHQAQTDGIDAICATPHIRHDHDVHIADLPVRIEQLRAAIRRAHCTVRVLPGGEVAATALAGLDDHELAAVALGGSGRWILLEPAPGPLSVGFDVAVARLRARGFRTLVAHPERHPTPDLVDRLTRAVQRGALVQATAASLVDPATREPMLALARAAVIHVLGSDSHSSRAGRPVALRGALEQLGGVEPTAHHLEWIARTAPLAIVRGEELVSPF
jgi:tyrosine-protein phosphatase YwqE